MLAAARDLTEHRVLTVKPRGGAVVWNEEELTAAGVRRAGFGHRNRAGFVHQSVVGLVGYGVGRPLTVGLGNTGVAVAVAEPLRSMTAGPVLIGEIAALNHEIVDDTVEDGPVVIAVLNEEFEVLNVNRRQIRVQFNGDRTAAAAAPRQFEFNDVGGRVASVGDVDPVSYTHLTLPTTPYV